MNIIKVPKTRIIQPFLQRFQSTATGDSELITKTVEYPPILDLSPKAVKRRAREAKYEKYRSIKSIEEKLFSYNMPKYYGWNSVKLVDGEYPYKVLPIYQHVTRTSVIDGNLESLYKATGVNKDLVREAVDKLRKPIQEALLFELKGRKFQYQETGVNDIELQNTVAKLIIKQINRTIISELCKKYDHLFDSTVDFDARVEAWWMVGGFYHGLGSTAGGKRLMTDPRDPGPDPIPDGEVEHTMQYKGGGCLHVRSTHPLRPLDLSEGPEDKAPSPPEPARWDPTTAYGIPLERQPATIIAGYWPGDTHEFGLLSYQLSGHLLGRPPHFGQEEAESTLTSQALMSSFAWCLAQAYYQGFSTYHEITYPLVNQCLVTDGRVFKAALYQLNTLLMYDDWLEKNPRVNMMLTTPSRPLYTDIENSEFVGWDDSVLESILMAYLNKPEERKGVNMKPNVDPNETLVADIEDPERRVWLHNQFRHVASGRSRHRLPYEIYDWEKIYKIEFRTRPMDARKRPFELGEDPIEDRKYYQHVPPYIPKAQRSKKYHWKGWRAKFAKTFYPEVE